MASMQTTSKKSLRRTVISTLGISSLAVLLLAGCGTNSASGGNSASNGTQSSSTAGNSPADKTSAINVTPNVDANANPAPGTIVIGTDDTYPPMEYTTASGRLLGFDVDLGDAIGQVLKEKVIWKPTAWDGIIPGLQANKYDAIISSMNVTPERQKQIQFVPYGSFGQVIVVKADSKATVTTLADLKGKKVGVQIGTTSEDALKKEGGITIKEYNTFPDALNDLANGRTDAVVVDESVGRYYMSMAPDKFKIAGQSFQSEPVGIGLRKDETQLAGQIQQALDTLKKNGTYDKIYQYWFGK